MPKKHTLFTHIGMVQCVRQFAYHRSEPRPMYLRAAPKTYIGWLPEDRELKFPKSGGYDPTTAPAKGRSRRSSHYYLDLSTVREATQEDYLAYYQAESDKAYKHFKHLAEIAEMKARELTDANKAAAEASAAHDKARADLSGFAAKVLKR